ncbi:LysR family transcriptional regulator [Dongia deserti]|uniref:LysR family transcriptional regulator n=1 Tax=Dongia deserti TaxID=2268030 RepID=UPI000E65095A|nr:LysR family transcriptional regulator [Dongia deserti]
MFDLTRLRLLRELAHRGTMTAVGHAFGMTSSAVSQQLAILEREARVALLERVGRRVRFTAEGDRLAAHAEAILQAVEAAELDLKASTDQPKGVLEIASFSTFAKARLLPAVIRMRQKHPEARVIIHELESADAIEAVRDGRCHLAVSFAYSLAPRPDIAGLVSHQLMHEPVLLALPERWRRAREPISLKRLAQEGWIVGSRQADDRQLAERACALAGFAPRITHTVDDYDLVLRMVAAGLGVGFVPELALRFSGAKGVVIRTPGGAPLSRRIDISTRTTLARSPMVRAFLAALGMKKAGPRGPA